MASFLLAGTKNRKTSEAGEPELVIVVTLNAIIFDSRNFLFWCFDFVQGVGRSVTPDNASTLERILRALACTLSQLLSGRRLLANGDPFGTDRKSTL